MADNVTLLDVSINTSEAVDGLDKLIRASQELADKKRQLSNELKAERKALEDAAKARKADSIDQTTYNNLVDKATTNIVRLTKDIEINKQNITANNAEIKANITLLNQQATSANSLRAQLSLNTAQLNKMTAEERLNGEAGRALAAQTKEISDQLKNMESAIGDNRRNVGNYAEDIEKAAGSMGILDGASGQLIGTMKGGIAGVKAFTAALMANPFIAIATAILAVINLIGKLMDRNDELATTIKSALAPIEWAIAKVLDVISDLFEEIAKVFEWIAEAYVKVYNWLGIISDETVKTIETAKGMERVKNEIYEQETKNIVVLAQQRRELEKQRTIVADQTKSAKERTEAAEAGIAVLNQMEEAEIAVLQAKYDQIHAQNNLTKSTKEDMRAEAEALAALQQRQAEYEAQRRELIGQRSGFEKAENDKRIAEDKARTAAYVKSTKEAAAKAAKEKEEAERKAAEKAKQIQEATLKHYEQGITRLQIHMKELQISIFDKESAIKAQDKINAAILEKERYRLQQGLIDQTEYDNIVYQMKVNRLSALAALQDEQDQKDLERRAIDLENKRILIEQQSTDEYELRQIQLDARYQQEIANAEKTGADITLIKQKYEKLQDNLNKARMNAELTRAAETAGQMSNLLGQESAAGKTFAIAQATINTYLAATKAMTSAPYPLNLAYAAITIATGLKQVAKIVSVKDDIPTIETSKKKLAKGGKIYGPSHAEGGVTFTGSNGQVFEAEGGENMYILNRRASSAINALSALNQEYGGRSFGSSSLYKFADGGKMSVIHDSIKTVRLSSEVKLSKESLKELALIVLEGFENAPNPIVSVQEFNEVDHNSVFIRDSVRD